jgi:hypothetical protein
MATWALVHVASGSCTEEQADLSTVAYSGDDYELYFLYGLKFQAFPRRNSLGSSSIQAGAV